MNTKRDFSIKQSALRIASRLSVVMASAYVMTNNAFAIGTVSDGADSAKGADQPLSLFGVNSTFSTITNVLLYVIGAIAVIMIVIGGLRYVLSGGDSNQISAAKNTILYAIIGIIIAILAYAIINFVIGSFAPNGAAGTNV